MADKAPFTRVLISNLSSGTLATLLEFLFSILVLPILIAGLGKHQYGIWILIGQTMSFLILSDAGVSSALGRFLAQARGRDNPEQIAGLIATGLWLALLAGVGLAVLVLLVARPLPTWLELADPDMETARAIFLINGLTLAAVIPLRLSDGVLRGYQQYALINALRTGYTILRGLVVLGLAAAGLLSLHNLAYGFSAASLLFYFSMVVAAMRFTGKVQYSIPTGFADQTRQILGLGSSSILMTASASIYREGIVLAAGPLLGAAAAGVYGVALTIIMRISGLLSQIGNPLITLASEAQARGEMKELRALSNGVLRVTFALGASAAAGLAVFGEPVLRLWLGRSDWTDADFSAAAAALTLMGASLAIGLPQLAARSLLQGVGKHWAVSGGFLVASLAGLGLAVWGMQHGWGILGAAAGWSLVLLAQGIIIYPPMMLRVLEQSLVDMLRRAYLPGAGVGLAVWGASAGMAAAFPPDSTINLLLGVGVGLGVGLAGLALISQFVRNRLLRILRPNK